MMNHRIVLSFLISATAVSAFGIASNANAGSVVSSSSTVSTLGEGLLRPHSTRESFLKSLLTVAVSTSVIVAQPLVTYAKDESMITLPNGVVYTIVKQGTGPKPERGELVALRFAAYNGEIQIDNIFDTPEPYYTRLGSGALIPGVEQALPLMQLGDRWRLTIPVRVMVVCGWISCLYFCTGNSFVCGSFLTGTRKIML
jgi:FKBP-type peptidyl-prolyl cis-trans isomerase